MIADYVKLYEALGDLVARLQRVEIETDLCCCNYDAAFDVEDIIRDAEITLASVQFVHWSDAYEVAE